MKKDTASEAITKYFAQPYVRCIMEKVRNDLSIKGRVEMVRAVARELGVDLSLDERVEMARAVATELGVNPVDEKRD